MKSFISKALAVIIFFSSVCTVSLMSPLETHAMNSTSLDMMEEDMHAQKMACCNAHGAKIEALVVDKRVDDTSDHDISCIKPIFFNENSASSLEFKKDFSQKSPPPKLSIARSTIRLE